MSTNPSYLRRTVWINVLIIVAMLFTSYTPRTVQASSGTPSVPSVSAVKSPDIFWGIRARLSQIQSGLESAFNHLVLGIDNVQLGRSAASAPVTSAPQKPSRQTNPQTGGETPYVTLFEHSNDASDPACMGYTCPFKTNIVTYEYVGGQAMISGQSNIVAPFAVDDAIRVTLVETGKVVLDVESNTHDQPAKDISPLLRKGTNTLKVELFDIAPPNRGGGNVYLISADTIPPTISNVTWRQDGKGGVIVMATITDNVSVAAAALWWNGQDYAMQLMGPDRYYAIVPGQLNGVVGKFHITAVDPSNNLAVWPDSGDAKDRIQYTIWAGLKTNTLQTGEPVNTATGNFYTRHQDVSAPGPGMPFAFERSYNAIAASITGPLGWGWTHVFNMHLQLVDDPLLHGVVITYADGHTANFTADGGGYKAPEGSHDVLAREDNGFVLTQPDQIKYHFNADGKLVSKSDRNHNQITLTYTGDDLSGIVDTAGRAYTLEYINHRLTRITDALGRTYEYTYDADGNLIQYKDPGGGLLKYSYTPEHWMLSIIDPNDHVFVTNTYDDRGRVIAQMDASGSPSKIEYVDERHVKAWDYAGNLTEHFYDAKLRAIQELDALGNSASYIYDDDDNVIQKTDKGGHVTKFSYDTNGNLLTRTDALNKTVEFKYDSMNNPTYKKDEAGYETFFEYDPAGNVIRVREQIDETTWKQTDITVDSRGLKVAEKDANGGGTQYIYDTQGNLTQVTDALGHLAPKYEYDVMGRQTAMVDGNSHRVSYTYDKNDRRVKITDPKGKETAFIYDGVGNLKSVKDRRGFITTYEYNENDSLIKLTDVRGNASYYTYDKMYHKLSYRNPRGYLTEYGYDAVYNLIWQKDAKGSVTRFQYNADGLLIRQTDALDQVKETQYDVLHRPWKVYDEAQGLTEYQYDAVGNLFLKIDAKGGKWQYAYDGLKRNTLLTNPLGYQTTFQYDALGNLIAKTDANGNTTQYGYDALNQMTSQSDALGRVITKAYDPVGNIITETDARENATHFLYDENDKLIQVTDALGGVTHYTYDEEGNRLTETDPNSNTTTYTYDALGSLLSVKLPMGQTNWMSYDENSNLLTTTNAKDKTVTNKYDETDLLKSTTTALGFVTAYDYDPLGRKVTAVDAEGNPTYFGYTPQSFLLNVRDALDGVTRYEYDPLGNLTAQIDANGHRTDFELDVIGQVKSEKNPIDSTWRYEYDGVGNRVRRVDANGVETRYIFDAGYRMTDIAYQGRQGVSYSYDANDNITKVSDTSGSLAFTYDVLNRVTKAERASGILSGKKITFGYDAASNRTLVGYPNNVSITYQYNANNWLISVSNPLGGATAYTYDPVGLAVLQQNPNQTWTELAYDNDNRLVRLFNGKPDTAQNLVSSFDYTLDKVGNRVRTMEKVVQGQVVTWDKQYTYDKLYRLTDSVFTPDKTSRQVLTSAYTYDAVGNRLTQTTNIQDKPNTPALPAATSISYTYSDANQMLTAGATSFGYDRNGNRIKMSGPERAIDYSYDVENRLAGAKAYNVVKGKLQYDTTLDFTYDGLGRRVQRGIIEKGVRKTASFLYDGQGFDLLAQYATPEQSNTIFYYRDQSKALSQHTLPGGSKGQELYYHYDGLGDVSAWTNQAGGAVQEYQFAPYGRLIDNNGPANTSSKTQPLNQLAFSGKLWDRELDTYYYGARDYDPTTGTWLTQDTYRGTRNDPMSLHRYMFVNDNPASLVDLYGFSAILVPQPVPTPTPQLGSRPSPRSSAVTAENLAALTRLASLLNDPMMKSLNGGDFNTPIAAASASLRNVNPDAINQLIGKSVGQMLLSIIGTFTSLADVVLYGVGSGVLLGLGQTQMAIFAMTVGIAQLDAAFTNAGDVGINLAQALLGRGPVVTKYGPISQIAGQLFGPEAVMVLDAAKRASDLANLVNLPRDIASLSKGFRSIKSYERLRSSEAILKQAPKLISYELRKIDKVGGEIVETVYNTFQGIKALFGE